MWMKLRQSLFTSRLLRCNVWKGQATSAERQARYITPSLLRGFSLGLSSISMKQKAVVAGPCNVIVISFAVVLIFLFANTISNFPYSFIS